MKAWQVQSHGEPSEVLRLVDIDAPQPGPSEVRLRVAAAALGLPDAFMCRSIYALTPPLPFTPGQEVCGTVVAVGDGVSVPIGTRAMGVTSFTDGRGGFAEETILRADALFPVPDTMDDAEAAVFRIGLSTAWIGLVRRANLQKGEHLLVLGAAGGSGAAAIQLGRALGAKVIAIAAGDEKCRYCTELGADVVIDRQAVPVVDAVHTATGGRGVDVVYDPVGGEAAKTVLRCLANEARFLAVGFASGSWVDIDTVHAVRRNYSLVGVYAGAYTREQMLHDHDELLRLAAEGRLVSGVRRTVPFEELPAALDEVASGLAIGKTVLLGTPTHR